MPYGRSDAIERIVRGGSPEIRSLNGTDRMERYGAYLSSIIERDVAPVAEVRRPDTLRRLVNQLAFRTAEELNIAGLGNVLGARRETVTSYLDILSRLGIVHRLAAWTSSGSRRDVKAPKIHFMNMGCATAVRGEDSNSFGLRQRRQMSASARRQSCLSKQMLRACSTPQPGAVIVEQALSADPSALGHLLESFVFCELEKSLPFLTRKWNLYHWRNAPREVDIVAEAQGRVLALFQMKASMTVEWSDFRHLDWFLTEGPGQAYQGAGFVIYLGDQFLSFGPGRLALPLSLFWSYATNTSAARR